MRHQHNTVQHTATHSNTPPHSLSSHLKAKDARLGWPRSLLSSQLSLTFPKEPYTFSKEPCVFSKESKEPYIVSKEPSCLKKVLRCLKRAVTQSHQSLFFSSLCCYIFRIQPSTSPETQTCKQGRARLPRGLPLKSEFVHCNTLQHTCSTLTYPHTHHQST